MMEMPFWDLSRTVPFAQAYQAIFTLLMSSFLLIGATDSIQCVPTGAQENFVGGLDRGLLHFTLPCTGGLAGTFFESISIHQFTP